MIMKIEKVFEETSRLNLHVPVDYSWALNNRSWLVEQIANGVGSETSNTYHFTPDTIWLLNINPASHPHDWMYTFPMYFNCVADGLAWKQLADHWFDINVLNQIEDCGGIFQPFRESRLNNVYNPALGAAGDAAFWANKQLPPDYEYYYRKRPDCDPELMDLYRDVYRQINLNPAPDNLPAISSLPTQKDLIL